MGTEYNFEISHLKLMLISVGSISEYQRVNG